MPTIAIMTDFGLQDIYVGVMKGVIQRICPGAQIIDITHAIPPQDVAAGAWALRNAFTYFPAGTVFLTIVDPDVGSSRYPIAMAAGGWHFVAPDNGVLTHVLRAFPQRQVVHIQNRDYALPTISATFHGRDIFAPAAAHLAAGVPLAALGTPVAAPVELAIPALAGDERSIEGAVVHVDHFGNIITNIAPLTWQGHDLLHGEKRIAASDAVVSIGEARIQGVRRAYYEVPEGHLLAQVDSSGALEVAIYKGSAQRMLGAKPGDRVRIAW
jgi:S-adenosylmethionine hydrolase